MKVPLLLLGSLIAAATAHAHDRFRWSGSIDFYAPACPPPVAYCPPPPVYYNPPPAPVYVAPAPQYDYVAPDPAPCEPRGYWSVTQAQVWVPGRYITQYDAYGCPVTYFIRGHYECRPQRVWVPQG